MQEVRDLIETRDWAGKKSLFEWVRGHNDDPGNVAADHLAVSGARNNLLTEENGGEEAVAKGKLGIQGAVENLNGDGGLQNPVGS